jgi:hypothetical protein
MGKFTPSRSSVNDLVINGNVTYEQGADLTIADGTITVTHSNHLVVSESGAGTDDLNRINGPAAADVGQILILRRKGGSGAITVKDNVAGDSAGANIESPSDRVLSNDKDTIILVWHGTKWLELSFADNKN